MYFNVHWMTASFKKTEQILNQDRRSASAKDSIHYLLDAFLLGPSISCLRVRVP